MIKQDSDPRPPQIDAEPRPHVVEVDRIGCEPHKCRSEPKSHLEHYSHDIEPGPLRDDLWDSGSMCSGIPALSCSGTYYPVVANTGELPPIDIEKIYGLCNGKLREVPQVPARYR